MNMIFLFLILSILNSSKIKVEKYIIINVKKNFIFIKIEKCINRKKEGKEYLNLKELISPSLKKIPL